jgi:hypothetical protein
LLEWLYGLNPDFNIHFQNDLLFRKCCENGNLDLVKWLYSIDGIINIHYNNEKAFRLACKNGNLDVAQWLYSLDDKPNIHVKNNNIFLNVIKHDHFDVAQWLYSIHKFNITIDHLDGATSENISKWLYSLNQNLNLHYDNDKLFKNACYNNYIDKAKWLYSLDNNINIRYNDDEIFKYACNNKHKYIAFWLKTLCNDYYIDVDIYNNILEWKIKSDLDTLLENKEYVKLAKKLNIKIEFEDDKCLICFSDNYNFITSCKHYYCFECFMIWHLKHNKIACCYCNQVVEIEKCIYQRYKKN